MDTKRLLCRVAPMILVFSLIVITGCDQQTPTRETPKLPVPFAQATPSDTAFCVLMSAAPLDNAIVQEMKSAAEKDLLSREPGMEFDFERAVLGPANGQISLVFANLTYLDLYEVYVGQRSDNRLLRAFRIGGLYYPNGDCDPK